MRLGRGRFLGMGLSVCLMSAAVTLAQQTTTETKAFEVVVVSGNSVVVRTDDGTQEYTVTDDFRFTVDGKPVSVRELQPGMKGTATITTTTTVRPVYVTHVENGTVLKAFGNAVLVGGAEQNRMFTQGEVNRRGITIVRDGRPVDLSELRAGDTFTATFVTEGPPEVMTEQQVQAAIASTEADYSAGAAPAPPEGATSEVPMPPAGLRAPVSTNQMLLLGVAAVALILYLYVRRRRMKAGN